MSATLQERIDAAMKQSSRILSNFIEPNVDLKYVQRLDRFYIDGYLMYVNVLTKQCNLPQESEEYLYFLIAHDINMQYNLDCGEQPMGTDLEIIWLLNELAKNIDIDESESSRKQFLQSAVATLETNLNQCNQSVPNKRFLRAAKNFLQEPQKYKPILDKNRFKKRLSNFIKKNLTFVQNHSAHFWRGGIRSIQTGKNCKPLTIENLKNQTACLIPINQNLSHIIIKKTFEQDD